ncbi:hypothetical protein BC827DRAFT_1123045 [Russula dissimulans]|nr:hypothetical protein BC827DRAFT_1123045 [Russula dissimulans]
MHPQDKRIGNSSPCLASHPKISTTVACREFFDALQLCHANVWAKWTGGCNHAKRELNKCLRDESVVRAAKNREEAKLRNARREKALRELHEND